MKILYLDFLYPKSHKRLDIKQINILSKIGEVYVVAPSKRYSNLPSNVHLIEKENLHIQTGRLGNRVSVLKIMFISATIANEINPDYILVSSYETMMFALGRFLFSNKSKIYLVQHFNIDELKSKVKRLLFNSYKNKINHIVFEEFIKKHLIEEFKIDSNRIHIIPHAITKSNVTNNSIDIKYRCVGLSNSNDEVIIADIVEQEKKHESIKKLGVKVLLKSKEIEFDNGYLRVIRGFLESDIFEEYIAGAQSIYMPFPKTFCYRMSGTLVDALSSNKIVYGSNIELIKNYNKNYKDICLVINNAEDFFSYILNANDSLTHKQKENFDKFKIVNSDQRIERLFRDMFC